MQKAYHTEQINAMIIDDHAPIRKAMKRILNHIGIKNVVECSDGESAMKELARQAVDIVLCDIYMRKVSGFDILTYIRNRPIGADIPVIIVTGEASKEDIVKSSALGADDYILKPFQADAMEGKVNTVLNNFYSPSPLVKQLRFGDKLMLSGNYEAAMSAYKGAADIDPNGPRVRYSIAIALSLMDKVEEAKRVLTSNIATSPSYYKSYGAMADIYLKEKDIPRAMEFMQRELELNPKQQARQAQLGKLMLAQGDPSASIEYFRNALKENLKNKEALLGAGNAYAKIDDMEKALYYFKRYRRHHPSDATSLEAAARVCISSNNQKKAETLLKDEKKMFPKRYDAYAVLAKFYIATERLDDAKQVLDELIQKDAENIDGLKVKGIYHLKTKDFINAYRTYTLLAKKEPNQENYIALANCLLHLKKIKEAIYIYHKVMARDNSNLTVLKGLGRAYLLSKQFIKANIALQRAVVLGSKDSEKMLKMCETQIVARRKKPQVVEVEEAPAPATQPLKTA